MLCQVDFEMKDSKGDYFCKSRKPWPMSDLNHRFTIVQHSEREAAAVSELENGSSVSRFHVAPILDQDGGEISCEVANRFGRDSKTFLLSIEGKCWNYIVHI